MTFEGPLNDERADAVARAEDRGHPSRRVVLLVTLDVRNANRPTLPGNSNGPRTTRRRLLMTTVQSILLYPAEIWGDTLQIACHRRRPAQVQRRCAPMAVRVACAYRTVSKAAIQVVASVAPIALLARERKAIFCGEVPPGNGRAKEKEREHTLRDWQASWKSSTGGRWTFRLIGQLKPWLDRQYGEVNYHLTQYLTGHELFRSYLKKMGKVASPNYRYCPTEMDNAEHTFFICDRWLQHRRKLETKVGPITPGTVVGVMLVTQDNWDAVSAYVEAALRHKQKEEDMRTAGAPTSPDG